MLRHIKIRVILITAIILFLIISYLPYDKVDSVTGVAVVLSDYRPYQTNVEYNISFMTSLGPGSFIYIHFMRYNGSVWVDNDSAVNEGVNSSQITCNGYTVGTILAAQKSTGVIQFFVPDSQVNEAQINVKINQSAGFGNGQPGTYKVVVYTANETSQVDSNTYNISNPTLQSVSVAVTPSYAGKNAKYNITAKTSNYTSSALTGGSDQLYVKFPSETTVPAIISANTISVKYSSTEKFVSTSIATSNNGVTFTVPSGISVPKDSTFNIVFYESAGIVNPLSTGNYKLEVKTLDSLGSVKDDLTESSSYSITSTNISSPTVVLDPSQVGVITKITVKFKTSSVGNLLANSGWIVLKFPEEFFVPPMISQSTMSINGITPTSVQISGKEVKIYVPQNINGDSEVTIVISSDAQIKNPATPGSYKLSIWTSSDALPVDSQSFAVSPSTVSSVKVTVSPQIAGTQAMYVITFQTGPSGMLMAGDKITIIFPQGTYVPPYISPDKVKVNNQVSSLVSVSNTTVTVSIPTSVSSNYTVVVQFLQEAAIKNPTTPKDYKILIHTSSETSDVESSPYTILKGVSTSISVQPNMPDGENGYYKTSPKIEIVVDAPPGVSYTVYYKWDDAQSFSKYTSSLEAPEGSHILSYYCIDSYNNKETIHTQSFKVDTQKPILSISSPEPNKIFYEKVVPIEGITEPGVELYVTVGSAKVQLTCNDDGKFQYTFTFANEGTSVLSFVAKDSAGNSTNLDLQLRYVFQRNIILVVGSKNAFVNSEEVALNEAPFIYKGRVLVPLRFVSETFGAKVEWDNIFKIVTIILSGQVIRLQVNNLTADLNGKAVTLDVAPMIRSNVTFVPIRFISEAFGAGVDWDATHGLVKITYPKK